MIRYGFSKSLVILIFMALATVSCAGTVKAWERGTLAKPQMNLVPDQQQSALMLHTYTSKEAGTGGYGVGGGGCGCN